MRALNLDGVHHAVVVAPHSDDETIGAFFTISTLRRRGVRVDVIVVTDGSASHRNSRAYPKQKLVVLRQAETLSAMQLAGVPPAHVTFLGLPDGGLRDLTMEEEYNALGCFRARPQPDLLIVPSEHDDHPDHRTVAGLCDRSWPTAIRRLRYVVWPSQRSSVNTFGGETGLYGSAAAKRAALRRYRSQTGLIQDDPDGFCLTPEMIARMCQPCERFTC
ncbi:PIG-L deacetylase family protein [Hasllibacter sp. MH4015]|uniref:PIG-L deacetylase family protein n=1 Tax=Hasllibacter sp. MH4015 TaxID=2854029 RepID=UPI001CD24C59|nr:PIG-L family deacetylase [Hasllibacter sp. MH4015]